jgi:AmmeMemoRadiSam system protein A
MTQGLNATERSALLTLARETLERHFEGRARSGSEPREGALAERRGAFVTLSLAGDLRGCIGHVEGLQPLWQSVRDNALSAAFRDPRFPPLSEAELGQIRIEISALTPLRRVTSVDEIEVGRHGLLVERGSSRGLLLPQVPVEWGWNLENFLAHTCRKAGLATDAWRADDTILKLFEADVFGEE